MKHQYFGDVNDFRKYGLLRTLQRETGLRLAVYWMLTPDDQRTDGQFVSYLGQASKWRAYDTELFDVLAEVVPSGRTLRHVEERQVLHGSVLIDRGVPDDRVLRATHFRGVLQELAGAELVFFDPDNGIEVPSCPPGRKDSSKYVAWSELIATYNAGRSLLIYQHFPRQARGVFVTETANKLRERTGAHGVTCFQTANVAFFLVAQPVHEEAMKRGSKEVDRIWGNQIKVSHYANSTETDA